MSISEFTSALRNKAVAEWFRKEGAAREATRLANINVIANPTSFYRNSEEVKEKTAFLLTRSTLLDMVKTFNPGIDNPEAEADRLFKQLSVKAKGEKLRRKVIKIKDVGPNSSIIVDEGVYFPEIGFGTITSTMNNLLGLKGSQLAEYYEKGHVYGLANRLMERTQKRLEASIRGVASSASVTEEEAKNAQQALTELSKVYSNIIDYYSRIDMSSANIKPISVNNSINLYADYDKRIDRKGNVKYLVELQLKEANQSSAREVREGLRYIRNILSPSTASAGDDAVIKEIDKLLGTYTFKGVEQNIVTDPKFRQDLLTMRSSPNLVDMIGNLLASTLTGKPIDQAYSGKGVSAGSKKQNIVIAPDPRAVKKLRDSAKANKAEAKKALDAVNKVKQKLNASANKAKTQNLVNLSSLQNFINTYLQDVISANMGDGNRRDILNYRTGRFASTVKVEKLSQSREGMITAFYSYMKNPYATFSEGGRQSVPKTRDPKLLISKSIREIVAEKVANRMRAVSI